VGLRNTRSSGKGEKSHSSPLHYGKGNESEKNTHESENDKTVKSKPNREENDVPMRGEGRGKKRGTGRGTLNARTRCKLRRGTRRGSCGKGTSTEKKKGGERSGKEKGEDDSSGEMNAPKKKAGEGGCEGRRGTKGPTCRRKKKV